MSVDGKPGTRRTSYSSCLTGGYECLDVEWVRTQVYYLIQPVGGERTIRGGQSRRHPKRRWHYARTRKMGDVVLMPYTTSPASSR